MQFHLPSFYPVTRLIYFHRLPLMKRLSLLLMHKKRSLIEAMLEIHLTRLPESNVLLREPRILKMIHQDYLSHPTFHYHHQDFHHLISHNSLHLNQWIQLHHSSTPMMMIPLWKMLLTRRKSPRSLWTHHQLNHLLPKILAKIL